VPKEFNLKKAQNAQAQAQNRITELIGLLDIQYPKIGKNFKV
jgi:hypothetical protein